MGETLVQHPLNTLPAGKFLDWNVDRTDLKHTESLYNWAPAEDVIDMKALRAYRLSRLRKLMGEYGMDAVLLCDSVNIRYATGTRNMQIWGGRNAPARYLLLTSDRSILYEFAGCAHLANGFEDTVDEVRMQKACSSTSTPTLTSKR